MEQVVEGGVVDERCCCDVGIIAAVPGKAAAAASPELAIKGSMVFWGESYSGILLSCLLSLLVSWTFTTFTFLEILVLSFGLRLF